MMISRRRFLWLAGAVGVRFLWPAADARAASARGPERRRSLVVLWLGGGPSQLETWDPHPGKLGLPADFAIRTRLADVRIARTYPRTAEVLDRLNVIRSLTSKEGDHERATYYLKTGYRPEPTVKHPTLGAILCQQLPAPGLQIPAHVSVGEGQWPARGGFLGDELDAFRVPDPVRGIENLATQVDSARSKQRLADLERVEAVFRADHGPQVDRTLHGVNTIKALAMMESRQREAFEIERESAAARAAYGASDFGRGCLLARRLVEIGVQAVEVTLEGFDSHTDNAANHEKQAAILDPALASLVGDLEARDLLASTVVLCMGEFGRTPKVNAAAGRDHWPTGFTALAGGGGLTRGRVIGATDPGGQKTDPADPVRIQDLHATLLKALGLDPATQLITPIGRPIALSDGRPLTSLLL